MIMASFSKDDSQAAMVFSGPNPPRHKPVLTGETVTLEEQVHKLEDRLKAIHAELEALPQIFKDAKDHLWAGLD